MAEKSNQELLDELGVVAAPVKKAKHTPREERIIAGFEEIQQFVEENGHLPTKGEDKDIFERLYATRLDQIRKLPESHDLLAAIDHQGLLNDSDGVAEPPSDYKNDEELLAELGVDKPKEGDVTFLKHVKSQSEKERAKSELIGQRKPCKDFDKFKPLFESVQSDIKYGKRKTLRFAKDGSINKGDFFIIFGQKAYIADVGDAFTGKDGRNEYRLRVIFDNGVESNQLMHSLQKRLWEDENGRRISEMDFGPLFAEEQEDDDLASGTIYVLRSKSDNPQIANNRDVLHKIGVTGGAIEKRIANAKNDATYLLADVEIVASYELFNINRVRLERLLHNFFDATRLDIEIKDRFGKPVSPREWFLVPLFVIDQVVEKIKDGSITNYVYDPESVALKKID